MTSCICNGCFRDWERNRDNRENFKPRWVKVKEEFYVSIHSPFLYTHLYTHQLNIVFVAVLKHNVSVVQLVNGDQISGMVMIHYTTNLETTFGKISHGIPSRAEHMCRHHFKVARRKIITSRKCSICSVTYNDSWWKLIKLTSIV